MCFALQRTLLGLLALLLGARTLLEAKGIATRNKNATNEEVISFAICCTKLFKLGQTSDAG